MEFALTRNENGLLEAKADAPHWRQGDDLVRYLKRQFSARIIDKAEGPDARMWKLKVSDKEITIHQWDTGDISFFGSPSADDLVTKLADSLRSLPVQALMEVRPNTLFLWPKGQHLTPTQAVMLMLPGGLVKLAAGQAVCLHRATQAMMVQPSWPVTFGGENRLPPATASFQSKTICWSLKATRWLYTII